MDDRNKWNNKIITSDTDYKALKQLLSTNESKEVQDEMSQNDVEKYINHGIELGITDNRALIYFADLENQGGAGASARIANTFSDKSTITLEILHRAALADRVMGKYKKRRNKTYNECLNIIV